MTERERVLDTALLQSGKFKDALVSLLDWLTDTEGLVENLRPPSTDYKVLKTQLQEQKVSKIQGCLAPAPNAGVIVIS